MAKDVHNHDLYANHVRDNEFCREYREQLTTRLEDYVQNSTAGAVSSTAKDAQDARECLEQIIEHDATVQYNMEQTIQYANQAKNYSDNSDRRAQETLDRLNRIVQLHNEVQANTNTVADNTNTSIQKAASASSSATLSRSWAIGDTDTREGEENNCSKSYCLRAENAYNKTLYSLKPKGNKTFAQLQSLSAEEKFECYMYTITDKFTTDDTFSCGAGTKCFPGTNVYWKNNKWNVLSGGGSSSLILDSNDESEITISKSKPNPSTASELAIWDGNEIKAMDTKKLFQMMYPVGSIYMSTSNTNPSTFIGGTWEEWGSGRVPVGVKTDDTNFDIPNQIGGSYTHNHLHSHTHNIDDHEHTMAHTHTINGHTHTMAHTHTGPSHTHTGPSHTHTMAHTHTGPSHTHSGPSHTHSVSGGAHVDVGATTVGGVGRIHLHMDRAGGTATWASNVYYWLPAGCINSTSAPAQVRSMAGVRGTAAAAGTGATGSAGTGNTSGSSAANTGSAGTGATGSSGTGNTSGSSAANTGGSGTLTSNDSSAANTGSSGTLTSNGSSAANTGGSGTLTSNGPSNPITSSSSTVQPYVTCYMWRRTA